MLRIILVFFATILTLGSARAEILLKSPSACLQLDVASSANGIELSLISKEDTLALSKITTFTFADGPWTGNQYSIISKASKNDYWKPVYGERRLVHNHYTEAVLWLSNQEYPGRSLELNCRLYDEGLAFKYEFRQIGETSPILFQEGTQFSFASDCYAWITDRAQAAYRKDRISTIKNACERPLVIELDKEKYIAIGEAGLVDYSRMKFIHQSDSPNSLSLEFSGPVDLHLAGQNSPWRYIMVAESPGLLLEHNYLIENLNQSNQLDDTSWIKPGKIIREVTLTTQGGLACIDFAAAHNLQYVEFDAGWYGNEYDEASDATTITVDPKRSPGPLDLHQVIKYANSKDIGIILYLNRRSLEKQIDEVLPLLASWGVKGVKYGFVNVGPQEWTSWLHEAVRKAAKYQLMVDVHDEYRPTGYSRTYPNLMTQEGIRGDEESPSTEHSLTTLFTRMIAGAGDNTNCYLAPRVSEKMGGKTAQMAKAILLYSPWQFLFWYDRPEGSPIKKGGAGAAQGVIRQDEDLSFFEALPTTWDESLVVEGAIGLYATMVRKKGDNWYVGALSALENWSPNLNLNFLDKDAQYEAIVYYQTVDDLAENRVKVDQLIVNCHTELEYPLKQNAGLAIILRKR